MCLNDEIDVSTLVVSELYCEWIVPTDSSVTYILLSCCTFYPQVGDCDIVTGYLGSIGVAVFLVVALASPLSCSWP